MAEPVHVGAPLQPAPADKLPDWMANASTRFGVIGDAWKVTANPAIDRGIRFNVGTGWSDGILTTFDDTNIPASFGLPADTLARYHMIVSRVNWQAPLTRTFVAIQSGGNKALPVNSLEFKREPGVIADYPVALVMVPGNSTQLGEIIDLRVKRGDNGWLMAESELVLQYLDRDGTVVEIDGALHRRKNGEWSVIGRTDEADPIVFRSHVMKGAMQIRSDMWDTVWNLREHTSDRPEGINFSGGVATIQRAGMYTIQGQVSFPFGEEHGLRGVSITVDPLGARHLHRTLKEYLGTKTFTITAQHEQYFAVGAQVSLQAYQETGENMTLPGDGDLTRWTIRRVGR